ncbi:MAG: helix-turn-helix transcriptional regulator [Bdellovibrionota bacterium]
MDLKTILRKIIREKGLTITSLSKKSKVPVQTLHGWLSGSEPKSIRQLKAVADCLGVDINYLCFGTKSKVEADKLEVFKDEINAGIFEVVLRRVKK